MGDDIDNPQGGGWVLVPLSQNHYRRKENLKDRQKDAAPQLVRDNHETWSCGLHV